MAYEIEKSRRSSINIEEAFVYIAENNLDKAVYFLVAIEDTLSLLAENPLMGWNRSFPNSTLTDLRVWRVKDLMLIYQVDAATLRLRLMRFVNSNRDFDKIDI